MFSIKGKRIGIRTPPYVIAEISANHNGDIKNAMKLIEFAADAGADAVKIQTYRPDTITLKSNRPDFQINSGIWKGYTLWDLYEWAHTPWEWHETLFNCAHEIGITIFSSPFDATAVDMLEELDTPAYKVASFEVVDLPLIRYIASTGKPMIMSTGMANFSEIREAVYEAQVNGCTDLALLHCVSGYPAPPEEYNLRTIMDLSSQFSVPVGLSDHTLCNTTAITSIGLGASIIEKHLTLDRYGGGPDDSFSLEPHDFKDLCTKVKIAWSALGNINYEEKSSENENLKFRRSLYFVKELKAGDLVTKDAIRSVRPGFGMSPKMFDTLIGKKLLKDVTYGTAVDESHFQK